MFESYFIWKINLFIWINRYPCQNDRLFMGPSTHISNYFYVEDLLKGPYLAVFTNLKLWHHTLAIPYQLFTLNTCLKPLEPRSLNLMDFYPWPSSSKTWLSRFSLTAISLIKLALLWPQFILVVFYGSQPLKQTKNIYQLSYFMAPC